MKKELQTVSFSMVEYIETKELCLRRGWIGKINGEWIYRPRLSTGELQEDLAVLCNKKIEDIKWFILSRIFMMSGAVPDFQYIYSQEEDRFITKFYN